MSLDQTLQDWKAAFDLFMIASQENKTKARMQLEQQTSNYLDCFYDTYTEALQEQQQLPQPSPLHAYAAMYDLHNSLSIHFSYLGLARQIMPYLISLLPEKTIHQIHDDLQAYDEFLEKHASYSLHLLKNITL